MSGATALASPLEPGNLIGGGQMQLGTAFATYTLGRLTGSARTTAVGTDLLRAQLLAQVVTGAVKLSVQRTRPDGTHLSFPSGHTSVSFASATVLQKHFGWRVGIPAYGLASYVAAARIQGKRHFLSDVAFGAAIGLAAGRTVTLGRGNARFALAPMAAPGGAGVSLTWIDRR
jgi:membrane-associated phospholipid phosphatase